MTQRTKKRKKKGDTKTRSRITAFLLITIAVLLGFIIVILNDKSAGPVDRPESPLVEAEDRSPEHPLQTIEEKPLPRVGTPLQPSTPERRPTAELSVVIDDVGNNLDELAAFLELPGKITFAVLPHLPHSTDAARIVLGAGKDVILHMPMEAIDGRNPGPGAIFIADSPETIREKILAALESVPGAIGMNNHMGSKATADERTMRVVLETIGEFGLFFLDSRTTTETKVKSLVPIIGQEYIGRNIFLDNIPTQDAVRMQLEQGLALADKSGSCIFIGHVQHQAVALILGEFLPRMPKMSYILSTLKTKAGEKKAS